MKLNSLYYDNEKVKMKIKIGLSLSCDVDFSEVIELCHPFLFDSTSTVSLHTEEHEFILYHS